MAKYVIEIPDWHPTPLNKLLHAHWGTAAKLKRADREMVWVYVKAPGKSIPNDRVKRSVELTITLSPKQRACDGDAYWKTVLDALVKAHALWNDSPAWCELLPVRFERGERKATRIELRDLA
jgi:Holliday junction resolvase RusA-like endonuclease